LEEETVQWTILLASILSMDETHICVLDREGAVVYEGTPNAPIPLRDLGLPPRSPTRLT
jgi:hypothetical protein